MSGGARESLGISPERIGAEVKYLTDNHLAPLQAAVAERLGVTDEQLRRWLHNHSHSTGSQLGVIPRSKVTEVLCLSLAEHFHLLRVPFKMGDLPRIVQTDPKNLHTTLSVKKGVIEELKRLGLVIRPKRQN